MTSDLKQLPHRIGLVLATPVEKIPGAFPGKNIIAWLLLQKLIAAELALDGVDSHVCLLPPFNQTKGFVHVDDLQRGLSVMQRVFADLNLELHLGWFDRTERKWCALQSSAAWELTAALGADDELLAEITKRQTAFLKDMEQLGNT